MDAYDVIIVGTGAGGGTLARQLAPSGKRILLLERGDWLPREPQNWLAQDVFVDNRYVSPDTWYGPDGTPFQPQIHYFVGGATKLYGAALYRMRERDFGELQHHDGSSPAWPITYDELEPYYTLAEQRYEVHGARGEDPTEPPSSAPYPFPAVSHEPRIQQLSDDLTLAGYHPFHAPCGVRLDEARRPFSACVRCMSCDGFPCPVHGKSDADVLGVRPALEHSNVTLLTNAEAVRLETSASGREISTVVVQRDGMEERHHGNLVVLACGAANTAKLLLRSAGERNPHGLANGSDQVGRNYMYHASQAVLALSHDENPTVFQKTLGINDFYFGSDDFEFPLGNIQMVGKSVAPMFHGEKPHATMLAPHWTLERIAAHAVDFWLSTEDLPRPENRVSVDREGRLTLAYTPTNDVPKQRLYAQLRSMLKKLRMEPDHLFHRFAYMKNPIPVAGCAHQAGTCRFGDDPATSVLDRNCRAHEVDNLYVVDTSVFPSISAVNPALTAMANSLRVGDRLLARMGGAAAGCRAGRKIGGDVSSAPARPKVVVLGGGFAGIGAARALEDADVDVVVVDRHDYHTFQPLLYQVATGLLPRSTVGHPLRALFHDQDNVTVHIAEVTGVDPAQRQVQLDGMDPLTYDHLIMALGAQVNFFGTKGAAKHAFPMYTLADAARLQDHILERWEAAERDPSLVADGALNVVVVGGGPTGVETAGALAELYHTNFNEDYPDLSLDHVRIVLVEAGKELFSMFEPELRRYAKRALEKRHVEVLTGELVSEVTPTRVHLASGTVIDAHTLVWGAGLQASPLGSSFVAEPQKGGRLGVEPDLTLAAHPEVYAVGDVAAIPGADGSTLPQLGSVALQAGARAGENLARRLKGKDAEPFHYHDKGTMATIGRGAGVIQLPHGRTMKGKAAWLAWGAVHLALLSTGEDRTKAMLDWTWAGFTHNRSARIRV